jgi:uncharacterized membrane protein
LSAGQLTSVQRSPVESPLTVAHFWRTVASLEADVATRTPVAELEVGDDIVLNDGGPDVGPAARYSFADVQRRAPLVILAVVFGMAVVPLGRPRGLLALAGICVTVGVLLAFVFPAVLERASPLGVALTGAIGIAVGTINLAHGISDRTAVAWWAQSRACR